MNRVDRLFGILTLLQSKKYVTAEKIAEAFGISVRTVYRDVKALGEQGVPVGFEPHKGYFVVQGYFLPPVSFTSEEANALLLMEAMVFGFTDKSIHTHYASALSKVKAVLRTTQKEKLDFLNNHIKLQMPACFNNDYEYLALIQEAIINTSILEIGYKNKNEEVSKRQLEPIGLIFYAFSWHLIGWCHHRQDYRDFKVSRILTIKNTGLPFLKTDHMAINDYMQHLPVPY
ncbi:helix-turn-helix transcriptional regulator [Rufibacter immobilis]|uniref:helix-turn-helix transcriptional regulator n=1 Tax=Rufibacter immobilis TaxID=1348778 RepID=UPI0035EAD3A6